MHSFDVGFLAAYFALLVFICLTSGRTRSLEDYLISERDLGALQAAGTIAASKIGGSMLVAVSALTYVYGIGAAWLFAGFTVGYVVFFCFARSLKPFGDAHELYTIADFFFVRYGAPAGYLVTAITVGTLYGWLIVNIIGGGMVISQFTAMPFVLAVASMVIVVLFYVAIGGFAIVVKTDLTQIGGILLLVPLLFYLISEGGITQASVNFSQIPAATVVSFFLGGLFLPLGAPELWQRVYAARDLTAIRAGLIIGTLVYVGVGMILIAIGLIVRHRLPGLDPDAALPTGLSSLLPVGFSGLAMIVLFSAIMSSIDTALFAANQSLCLNFFGRILGWNKQTMVIWIRRLTIVVMAAAGLGAVVIGEVVDATLLLAALTITLGTMVLLVWTLPRLSAAAVTSGLALGSAGAVGGALVFGIAPELVILAILFSLFGSALGPFFARSMSTTIARRWRP